MAITRAADRQKILLRAQRWLQPNYHFPDNVNEAFIEAHQAIAHAMNEWREFMLSLEVPPKPRRSKDPA